MTDRQDRFKLPTAPTPLAHPGTVRHNVEGATPTCRAISVVDS